MHLLFSFLYKFIFTKNRDHSCSHYSNVVQIIVASSTLTMPACRRIMSTPKYVVEYRWKNEVFFPIARPNCDMMVSRSHYYFGVLCRENCSTLRAWFFDVSALSINSLHIAEDDGLNYISYVEGIYLNMSWMGEFYYFLQCLL